VSDGSLDVNQSGTAEKLFLKLPVSGTLKVSWAADGKSSSLALEVSVSKLTEAIGQLQHLPITGGDASGKLSLKLTNGTGLEVTLAEVKIDEISLTPGSFRTPHTLGFKNVLLRYEKINGQPAWTGQALISLPVKKTTIDAGGRVTVIDEHLARAGLTVDGLNQPIPDTPLFLQRLDGDLALSPFGFKVGAGATLGPKVEGKQLFTLDGTIGSGSLISALDCPNGTDPFKIEGKAKLAPLDNLERRGIARVEITASTCGYVGERFGQEMTLAGKVDFFGGTVGYESNQSGFVGTAGANLEGSATVRLPLLPDLSGKAVVSTTGIAACGSLNFLQAGWGFRWGDARPEPFTGCDLSPYRAFAGGAAAAAAAVRSVHVARGLPHLALAVSSAAGAPRVTVSGPGGVVFRTPIGRALRTAHAVIVAFPPNHTTYVLIDNPRAGTWKVSSDRPITRARLARGLPRPKVSGRIRRRGRNRMLVYTVKPLPGQRVRFAERGRGLDHDLGTARGRRETLKLQLRSGAPTRRSIVAVVTQDGVPRATLVLARLTRV
jgi:hypothetical protein